jgi:hypothetical protein
MLLNSEKIAKSGPMAKTTPFWPLAHWPKWGWPFNFLFFFILFYFILFYFFRTYGILMCQQVAVL